MLADHDLAKHRIIDAVSEISEEAESDPRWSERVNYALTHDMSGPDSHCF